MIGWFWRVLVGHFSKPCDHRWAVLASGPWEDRGMGTCGTYYTLQCQNCGNIKSRKG